MEHPLQVHNLNQVVDRLADTNQGSYAFRDKFILTAKIRLETLTLSLEEIVADSFGNAHRVYCGDTKQPINYDSIMDRKASIEEALQSCPFLEFVS